jgi:hypothetical protein
MMILAAYKARLLAAPAVATKLKGGIHVAVVAQNSLHPHILLELVEEGQDYTHQGPVGLLDAHIRVTCRCANAETALPLGDAVVAALENWTGTLSGCWVQLSERFNTAADFEPGPNVFRHISEYTAYYRRTT